VGPLVAEDVTAVDNVMRWGFQWELGPYEIEDLRGITPKYYGKSGADRTALHFAEKGLKTVIVEPEYATIADLKSAGRTVMEAPEGALIDMGDGVACLEMRTKMNTFGPQLCDFFDLARDRAEREFCALVTGSDAPYFSAGFNLKLFLEAAPKEDWAAIDAMLHQVQNTFMSLKYSSIPSVAAVKGYTLGGGCECAFACSAIQAAPELTMGLPELPAGLIPAGGAFKELLKRTFEGWDGKSDAYPRADRAADFIVAYPPSSSAAQAKKMGLLRDCDGISRNADRLLFDAKQRALSLANDGYSPPVKRGVWAVGAAGLARMQVAINDHFNSIRRITEHDRLIANCAAYVMCGGPLSAPQEVSEQYMLNLERVVFLTLVQQPKTIARIEHLLATGKPLSN
jgi:3-hydroxyacyl-CoA dehydrogenase